MLQKVRDSGVSDLNQLEDKIQGMADSLATQALQIDQYVITCICIIKILSIANNTYYWFDMDTTNFYSFNNFARLLSDISTYEKVRQF